MIIMIIATVIYTLDEILLILTQCESWFRPVIHNITTKHNYWSMHSTYNILDSTLGD